MQHKSYTILAKSRRAVPVNTTSQGFLKPLPQLALNRKIKVMPYDSTGELPEQVKDNLPKHTQTIYKKAFNNAWDEYSDPDERKGNQSLEETAHRVAWNAVQQEYEKEDEEWKRK